MTNLISERYFLDLAKLNPIDVCRRASCSFEARDKSYSLPVWDTVYTIYPDTGKILCSDGSRVLHKYLELFAVHYLLTAQDLPVTNEWISEKDIPGGVTFFRGPHEIPTKLITARVDNSTAVFKDICLRRGGVPLDMADAAFVLRITNRIPVAVLYWSGDDEFPSESKILYDKTLQHHFALDIIYALSVGICAELSKN